MNWYLLLFYDGSETANGAAFLQGLDGNDAVKRAWQAELFSREGVIVREVEPQRLPSDDLLNRRLSYAEISRHIDEHNVCRIKDASRIVNWNCR